MRFNQLIHLIIKYLFFVILFFLLECSNTPITAEIGITNYSWLEKSYGRIKIINSEGETIFTKDIKIILNDIPLKSTKSVGNYYEENIFFNTPGMVKNKKQKIEIIFNKNIKLFTEFKIPSLEQNKIILENDKMEEKSFVVYKNVYTPSTIFVMRTIEKIEKGTTTTISGGRYGKDTIEHKINESNGKIEIPKRFFKVQEGKVSELTILLSYETDIPVESTFSSKSKFKILNEYKKIMTLNN